jgi:hypothetical protein
MPLERDEGEYAYAGQLMLQGIPPYKLAYNMKLPGTYAAYAVIMAAFGETTRAIHLGLVLVNSLTTILLYFLGRRLFGQICGLIAAAIFSLLALSPSVMGLSAHATHFVTLFGVAGALILWRNIDRGRRAADFWSGLLFSLSFLMKQQGVFFAIFGASMLVWHELHRKPRQFRFFLSRLIAFAAGAVLPFAIACGTLAAAGVFDRFWFWTFTYARQYVAKQSLSAGWMEFKSTVWPILHAAAGIWLLVALGIAIALSRMTRPRATAFVLAFAGAAFATTVPGLYFREHYFIPLLPAVGLIAGAGIQTIYDEIILRRQSKFWLAIPLVLILLAFGEAIYRQRAIFFTLFPRDVARTIYGVNPFPESIEIARYIREHSRPDSRIAVIGSEPEIYFYSGRHSATGYIYTYPLMEPQMYALTMQREMITEIERAIPDFVVFVEVPWSWLAKKESHPLIFEWAKRYIHANMRAVGLIEIQPTQTRYRWDEKAVAAIPRSNYLIWVFKRNEPL